MLHEDINHNGQKHFNEVDGKNVPIPHFGIVLNWNVFQIFSKKLIEKNIDFQIEPYLRLKVAWRTNDYVFYDPQEMHLNLKALKI